MAYVPNSGSVVAFQSKPSSLLAGVSVIGLTPVNVVNMPSPSIVTFQQAGSILAVSGNFTSGNTSVTAYQGGTWQTSVSGGYVNVIGSVLVTGSVAAFQGTDPWKVNVPTSSYISYQLAGSIMAVSATVNTGNSSVQLLGSQAVIGSVAVLQGTNPWQINMPSSSVIAYQLAGSIMAVAATVNTGNSSVQLLGGIATIGSVVGIQGTNPYIMTGSVQGVMSVLGTVPVTQATTPWIVGSVLLGSSNASIITVGGGTTGNSSVTAYQGGAWSTSITGGYVNVIGSVLAVGSITALQGTNPWIVNVPTSSYLSIQPAGSVMNVAVSGSVAAAITNFTASVAANINVISASIITNQGTNPWVIGSIVGTYAEDAASSSGDKGLFVMGVRNDTMTSMTSADLDYSSHIVGPAGEMIMANSPITKWVSGRGSIMYGGSIQLLAPPGSSIFTYITGINVINESATLSRVTITQGLGGAPSFSPSSILTWAIAPATGGSNATFPNPIRVLDNNGVSASISGVSSVLITITGFTSKT